VAVGVCCWCIVEPMYRATVGTMYHILRYIGLTVSYVVCSSMWLLVPACCTIRCSYMLWHGCPTSAELRDAHNGNIPVIRRNVVSEQRNLFKL
jgi:hypothetical protein